MHSNVTIKNVSWPHFSWATLYVQLKARRYWQNDKSDNLSFAIAIYLRCGGKRDNVLLQFFVNPKVEEFRKSASIWPSQLVNELYRVFYSHSQCTVTKTTYFGKNIPGLIEKPYILLKR